MILQKLFTSLTKHHDNVKTTKIFLNLNYCYEKKLANYQTRLKICFNGIQFFRINCKENY